MSESGGVLVPILLGVLAVIVVGAAIATGFALAKISARLEGLERRPDPVFPPFPALPPYPSLDPITAQINKVASDVTVVLEVSRRLEPLPDLLKPPKLRGGIGEQLLTQLLSEILPADAIRLQHQFGDGSRVDAAVVLGKRLLPIDSKFPLESFTRVASATDEGERMRARRDFVQQVRNHMSSVARYIRPAENTLDLALMYIPAENVYYETIIRDLPSEEGASPELFTDAIAKRVIPVSPNTLYAYLQIILIGLREMSAGDDAKRIVAGMTQVRGDVSALQKSVEVLGGHLKNAGKQQEGLLQQVAAVARSIAWLLDRPAGPTREE